MLTSTCIYTVQGLPLLIPEYADVGYIVKAIIQIIVFYCQESTSAGSSCLSPWFEEPVTDTLDISTSHTILVRKYYKLNRILLFYLMLDGHMSRAVVIRIFSLEVLNAPIF